VKNVLLLGSKYGWDPKKKISPPLKPSLMPAALLFPPSNVITQLTHSLHKLYVAKENEKKG
jgi:hypothetical protein